MKSEEMESEVIEKNYLFALLKSSTVDCHQEFAERSGQIHGELFNV
jgi:hypothetical protein